MADGLQPNKWKAALTGAVACGLAGPTIGVLAMVAVQTVKHHYLVRQAFGLLLLAWITAIVLVAPMAFLLGGAGGLILQFLSGKARSMRVFRIQAAVLGMALGVAVPWKFERDAWFVWLLALGGATGLACTALVVWQLHRRHLLRSPRA